MMKNQAERGDLGRGFNCNRVNDAGMSLGWELDPRCIGRLGWIVFEAFGSRWFTKMKRVSLLLLRLN